MATAATCAVDADADADVDTDILDEIQALKREKEAMQRELEEARQSNTRTTAPSATPAPASSMQEELEKERQKTAALAAEVAKKDEELECLRAEAAQLEALAEKLRQEQAEKKMETMTAEEKEKFKREMAESLAKMKAGQSRRRAAALAAEWERAAGKEGTALQQQVAHKKDMEERLLRAHSSRLKFCSIQ
eukprot:tig00020725_g13534.t1